MIEESRFFFIKGKRHEFLGEAHETIFTQA
jgi:hypothetical protein